MARGDSTYARGNVDWPTDPQCTNLPDNNCRWLHEVFWRVAVKERSPVIPRKYNPRWFAKVCDLTEKQISDYVRVLVRDELLGVTQDNELVVFGVINQHPKLQWKMGYPQTVDWRTLAEFNWVELFYNPHTGAYGADTGAYRPQVPYIEIENEIEIETESDMTLAPSPATGGTSTPTPVDTAPLLKSPPAQSKPRDRKPPEPPPKPEDVFLTFPCDGTPPLWHVTKAKLAELAGVYKTVHVDLCLIDAHQWVNEKPEKRKTASGMPAFVGRWLRRAVNRGEHKKTPEQMRGKPAPVGKSPVEDLFLQECTKLQARFPQRDKRYISELAETILDLRKRGLKITEDELIRLAEAKLRPASKQHGDAAGVNNAHIGDATRSAANGR